MQVATGGVVEELFLYFVFGPLALLAIFNALLVLFAVAGVDDLSRRLQKLSGAQDGIHVTTGTLLQDSAARSITLFLIGFVPVIVAGAILSRVSEAVDLGGIVFPLAGAAGFLFGLVRSCIVVFRDDGPVVAEQEEA